jgi:hypothetical protein
VQPFDFRKARGTSKASRTTNEASSSLSTSDKGVAAVASFEDMPFSECE